MELMTELLEAGVHFGHQTKRWNPKMKPFIFEKRNSIYIINLSETVKQLQVATDFLANVARQKGKVLFIGCKKQAQEAVKEAAVACGQFYVNQRWLGGTLTNLTTIRKSVGRMTYLEQIEKSPEYSKMGKQELSALRREAEKLRRNLEGIRTMDRLPDAMVIIDTPPRIDCCRGSAAAQDPDGRNCRHQRRSGSSELSDCRKRRRNSCDSSYSPEIGRRFLHGCSRGEQGRNCKSCGCRRISSCSF
jgi:small subunit ribosomal protein S2